MVLCALSTVRAEPKSADVSASLGNDEAQALWIAHVEPILNRNCYKCHGGVQQKGGLDLRLPQSILKGGDDGSAIVPGRPGDSLLVKRLLATDDEHMPPDENKRLKPDDVELIKRWVEKLPVAAGTSSSSTSKVAWSGNVPSLIEIATQSKWQPPGKMSPSQVIDYLIERRWQEQHVSASDLCDDRTYVRRIFLDVIGRIPTRTETAAFVNDSASDKRARLVDQLLASSEYSKHLAEVLDVVLMERKGNEAERKSNGWLAYLERSIAANRPWDQMVYDMIAARSQSAEQKGALWFLYERKNNYQLMAEAVAPVAFGVQIGCAQCHDHPLAHEIGQKHYWGLVAAFNRSTNVDTDAGLGVAESAIGGFVTFTNLKKESQPAVLTVLSGQTIAEQRPAVGAKEEDFADRYLIVPPKEKKRAAQAAIPKFSRRQKLAEAVTRENPLLARAFVNRMWALLMGRGLVPMVDQMDSRHPASHPELLAWLATDFEKSGYDIKRLMRTILLSRTYQLDSRFKGSTPPAPELFARGLEKPLMAEVLWRSLLVVSGQPMSSAEQSDNAQKLRRTLMTTFPDVCATEYNASLQQAMFLSNNPGLNGLFKPDGQNTTARLLQISDQNQRVREAFEIVLGRLPTNEEMTRTVAYLDSRADRPEAGVRQMLWALVTDAEFLLNH